jgi:hypothetical protein
MVSMTNSQPAQSVLDEARKTTREQDDPDLKSLLEAFGDRSFGPVLLLLPLIALSPVGGVPFVPSVIGVTIILFSVQLMIGRSHPWLPQALHRISIPPDKLDSFLDKAGKPLKIVDKIFERRWQFLLSKISKILTAIVVTGLAALMIPLEVIPFAVIVPALSIAILAAALIARDGLIMAIGLAVSLCAFGAAFYVLL